MNETERTLAPFIDSAYYNEVYKPNKNARIEGTFNNVDQHKANFDAFRNRASEIVDRIISNKITAIGGIDFAGQLAQATLRKATAAFVEHWYIKGFVMADLDSNLSLGGMSARQLISTKSFREIAPLNALALIQKSGMWDNKIVGVDLTKELADMGISASEIVTWMEAIAIFEQKGMGLNFHIEGDLSSVLTGLPNVKKYVKIAETDKDRISFDLLGGSDDAFTQNKIEVVHNGGLIIKAEAFVWSQDVVADTPDFYTKFENGKMEIYIEVPDDLQDKQIAISNVYPDQTGEYGVLGSLDNSNDLSLMSKLSVIGNVSKLDIEVPTAKVNAILPKFGLPIIATSTVPVVEYSDILTDMFDNLNDYKIEVTQADGTLQEVEIQKAVQTLSDSIGQFSNDDPNGVLDDSLSLIRNLVVAVENTNASLARISTLEIRVTTTEGKISTNIADIITLQADLVTLSERLASVENSISITDREWTGDVQLITTGNNISNLVANDGKPFDFTAGNKIGVSIKHSGDNAGTTQTITVGSATPKVFVIPTGNQSDTLGVQLAPDGSLTTVITNGNDTIPEFALYELVEEKAIVPATIAYTKAESDAKYYTKAAAIAEKTRVDAELAKKANTTDVQTKADAATETTRVNNELTKKADTTVVNAELAKKANLTIVQTKVEAATEKTRVDAELAKKFTNPTNAGITDQILTKTATGSEWKTPASGGGGSGIVKRDITSSYETRDWTNDVGKKIIITYTDKNGVAGNTTAGLLLKSGNSITANLIEGQFNASIYSFGWGGNLTGGNNPTSFLPINRMNEMAADHKTGLINSLPNAVNITKFEIIEVDTSGGSPTWTTINDLWTNVLKFDKYKERQIRVTSGDFLIYGISYGKGEITINNHNFISELKEFGISALNDGVPNKITTTNLDFTNTIEHDITKVEVL